MLILISLSIFKEEKKSKTKMCYSLVNRERRVIFIFNDGFMRNIDVNQR